MRAILLLCTMLAGCGTILPKVVNVPVPVPCVPAKSAPVLPKITPDKLLAKLDDRHLILIIGAERLDLISYSQAADAVISACR